MKNNFIVYMLSTIIVSCIVGLITGVLGLWIIGPDWFTTCSVAGFLATVIILANDYE